MPDDDAFTIGVEEEFLIVDPESRRLRSQAEDILPEAQRDLGDNVEPEFKRSQLETGTPVCWTLEELRGEIVGLRRKLSAAAERTGARIAAAGTHPFSHREGDDVTPKESYIGLERDYQRLAREKIICGCHVHVGMTDGDMAIQVMNRVRPWLGTILAPAVNSPFWLGEDTGYGSFRTEIWRRWPTSGTPGVLESYAEYEKLLCLLLDAAVIDDPARLFWDVRPSARFDTLEFRVTDVCLTVDDAVMVAGLIRALVRTCHQQAERGEPCPLPPPELVQAATWRAARYGLEGELVDVVGGRSVPARQAVQALLECIRPSAEDQGEWDELSSLVGETLRRGTAAVRQRQACERSGRLEDVVDLVISETTPA
ncbi:MAG: glutamate--cysteine ligase [Actinomycetota bacterium]|nr:glutamate--cysteine ligase [Actinomycetota bacterium]